MENRLSSFLFNKVGIDNYRKFLDLTSLRHKLVAGNVANVSTPGYRARDVDFKAELGKITKQSSRLQGVTTHANHIPTGQHEDRPPKIHSVRPRSDELNSVDIDQEVPKMAQNELMFTAGATLLKRKFEGLRKAITGSIKRSRASWIGVAANGN